MQDQIPEYVTKAFATLKEYNPDNITSNIKCFMKSDIEIYSIIFIHNFEYYQATTCLDRNYSSGCSISIMKL